MLKIVAIGNLTNDVELKIHEATGKPYAILRIASDRRYRDKEGNRLTDFISIKVRGRWRNAARSLPGRAASWPPPATLKPSLSRTSRSVSPVSSSKPRRWSSCLPAGWRKTPRPCLRTAWMRPQPERHAEYRH